MAKTKRQISAVERDLIAGFTEFVEDLKSGKPIAKKYRSKTIAIVRPAEYTPKLVRETRETLGLSQSLFGQFIGVSTKTVASWEQGKEPSEIARRFMDQIRRDPAYWKKTLKETVKITRREPRVLGGRQASGK